MSKDDYELEMTTDKKQTMSKELEAEVEINSGLNSEINVGLDENKRKKRQNKKNLG